jgi:uncharacterized protein YjeT (DUF2065 family)
LGAELDLLAEHAAQGLVLVLQGAVGPDGVPALLRELLVDVEGLDLNTMESSGKERACRTSMRSFARSMIWA